MELGTQAPPQAASILQLKMVISRKESGATESKPLPSEGMVRKFYSHPLRLSVSWNATLGLAFVVESPAPPSTFCVVLAKSLNVFVPLFLNIS